MDAFELPEAVVAALAAARAAYAQREFAVASVRNEEARRIARELGSRLGEIRATRYLGLCGYRRGMLVESEALLREARAGAVALGWAEEELLVCNHLGATLRKLGRLDDADAVFRWALACADSGTDLSARARLTMNYGAFLDDLGDRDAADDKYAEAERLLERLDAPGRLANARGLVSRAARLRGDARTALEKAESERLLGRQAGEALRESRGWLHIAQAKALLNDDRGAEEAFLNAEEALAGKADVRSPIELAVARGEFFLARRRLVEADARVVAALDALEALSKGEHEHRAHVHQLAARVAAASGLHGEALWHLGEALEAQLARFEPIADPRLAALTGNRRRELTELGARLLHEAGAVERESEEEARVKALLTRLHVDAPPQLAPPREWVDVWRTRVRVEAEERWGDLLPDVFDTLSPASRGDLVLSDVVYHGHVGDLPRSLLLLFVTLERELRERVFRPLGEQGGERERGSKLDRLLRPGRRYGLGEMLEALSEWPTDVSPEDAWLRLERRLGSITTLRNLARLRAPGRRVDGAVVRTPVAARNAIAHGEPWSWDMRRIEADAVKRALALGPESPLAVVLRIPLAV